MKHWLMAYTFTPDYAERRGALRAAHLAHAWASVGRGELLLGGALEGLAEGMLLFAVESAAAPEAFARADPYVREGLVTGWRVAEWFTVVGADAADPVR